MAQNSSAVVRIHPELRRLLKIKAASINAPMSDLANLFIHEGLALKTDHIQMLLATQEIPHEQEVDEGDVENRLF